MASILIRMAANGPFRLASGGPGTGAALHSDVLFAAVCEAAARLGWRDEWLGNGGTVRLSSAFPYSGETLLAPPPLSLWPPASSGRVRFDLAEFVPAAAVRALLRGEALAEERWVLDAATACVLPAGRAAAPFRRSLRTAAAVDRIDHGRSASYVGEVLEFARDGGFWCVAEYDDPVWNGRLRGAFRLLGDSGVGAERSRGWGRFDPHFEAVGAADLFGRYPGPDQWLLSLFAPEPDEGVEWDKSAYRLLLRAGRTGGRGLLTGGAEMVAEGSTVRAPGRLRGRLRDVTPAGASHPAVRAGFAVAVALPERT